MYIFICTDISNFLDILIGNWNHQNIAELEQFSQMFSNPKFVVLERRRGRYYMIISLLSS
jgi:hypothetical protein